MTVNGMTTPRPVHNVRLQIAISQTARGYAPAIERSRSRRVACSDATRPPASPIEISDTVNLDRLSGSHALIRWRISASTSPKHRSPTTRVHRKNVVDVQTLDAESFAIESRFPPSDWNPTLEPL